MPAADEVVIKFSKWKIVWFAVMILAVIGGLVSLLQGGSVIKHVMSFLSMVIGAMLAYQEFWNLLELNKHQLVISIKGITTPDGEDYQWQDIANEKLVPLGSIKPTWFLWFETPGRNRKLHLDGLDKPPAQIMALIKAYRQVAGTENILPVTINDHLPIDKEGC